MASARLRLVLALAIAILPLLPLTVQAASLRSVVIIGDNITETARNQINTAFTGRGWNVVFDTQTSRSMRDADAVAKNHESDIRAADAVVFQLGTYGSGGTGSDVVQAITATRNIKSDVKVYWVDIGSNANGKGKDGTNVPEPINNAISTYSERNRDIHNSGRLTAIGWFKRIFPGGDPIAISDSLQDSGNLLENDKVTPSSAGAQAMATMLADVIAGTGVGAAGDSQFFANNCLLGSGSEIALRRNNIEFTDGKDCELPPCEAVGVSVISGTQVTDRGRELFEALQANIEQLKSDYIAAAQKENIPWQALAAIHAREANNRPGTSIFAGEPLGSNNPDGHDVSDDQRTNFEEGAAFLKRMVKSVYGVDLTPDSSTEDWKKAFLSWNRGSLYKQVPPEEGGPWPPEKSPYVMQEYSPEYSGMRWPDGSGTGLTRGSWGEPPSTRNKLDQRIGALTVFALLSEGSTSTAQPENCSGAGGLATANGLTFPLRTTQKIIQGGSDGIANNGDEWCYQSTTNCHGTRGSDFYNAEDIHAPPPESGTPTTVVAARGGTVASVYNTSTYMYILIDGDDGNTYLYQHLKPASNTVSQGETVAAGRDLGIIGNSAAAEETAPHLHFDLHPTGSITSGVNRACVSDGTCREASLRKIDVHAQLVELYKTLPEE